MIIYESQQAKANRVDYRRRNTMYRLTNTDSTSEHFGQVLYHSAVTARREFGMEKQAFYALVAGGDPGVKTDRVILISDNWN